MNDYELLKTIFDNFEVEGKKIPAEFITYTGKSKTYITYAFIDDDPALFAEDQEVGSVAYIDIDIFSNGNYLAIERRIKEVMAMYKLSSIDIADYFRFHNYNIDFLIACL